MYNYNICDMYEIIKYSFKIYYFFYDLINIVFMIIDFCINGGFERRWLF